MRNINKMLQMIFEKILSTNNFYSVRKYKEIRLENLWVDIEA